jgi:ribosome-associated protein YbcJ (S4-like RNA binding protein)
MENQTTPNLEIAEKEVKVNGEPAKRKRKLLNDPERI